MVRLKLKGDFYVAHPEDAQIVQSILGEKREGEVRIPVHQIGQIISTLIKEKGCRVEEYAEIDGKEVLIREASPGNWTEFAEYLLNETDAARAAGVVVQTKRNIQTVYLASISVLDKTASLFEFQDTEIFTNLAQILYEENVKEVAYSDSALEKVFRAIGISYQYIKEPARRDVPMEKAELLVEKMLNIRMDTYQKQKKTQAGAMRMDASVAKSILEGEITIWDEIKCTTPQGKRLLRTVIRAPSTNKEEIERRHAAVEELLPVAEGIAEALKHTPDIMLICRRILKGSTKLASVIKIGEIIKSGINVAEKAEAATHLFSEIEILKQACENCKEVLSAIDEAVDPLTQNIKHNYTDMLLGLHSRRKAQEKEIYFEASQEIEGKKLYRNKVKIEKNSLYGYCMKAPRKESASISGYGFISLSVHKTGTFFTTSRIKQLDLRIREIQGEIEKEVDKAVSILKEKINWYRDWLEMINQMVATIDLFSSLARFAKRNHLVRPIVTERTYEVKGVYHPLLPAIHRRQRSLGLSPPEITKNNFSLVESNFCVITGPNMGGKTTFLKTIALVSIMAQIGSFVPAEKAFLPIFTSLFIRMGAADAPEKNVSTFMAEMNDVSKILNQADKTSLVIIDELGRGTSDADGYAIAQAAVEHILSLGATTLFATHFYDMCNIPGVCNKRVGVILQDEQSLIMTYKIEDGASKGSYGINTAKHAGLPEEVIETAEKALESV